MRDEQIPYGAMMRALVGLEVEMQDQQRPSIPGTRADRAIEYRLDAREEVFLERRLRPVKLRVVRHDRTALGIVCNILLDDDRHHASRDRAIEAVLPSA